MAKVGVSSQENESLRPGSGNGRYDSVDGAVKEEGGRKPLSDISIPSSGRVHGAPKSPVRVDVPQGDWPPQSQRGSIVEGSEYSRHVSGGTRSSEQYGDLTAGALSKQDMAFRSRSGSNGNGRVDAERSPSHQTHLRMASNESPNSRPRLENLQDVEESDDVFVNEQVPQLQYHHQSQIFEEKAQRRASGPLPYGPTDPGEVGPSIDRYLTPNSQFSRGTPLPRPHSTYSDFGPRSRSPGRPGHIPQSPSWGFRAPSAASGRSNERPLSYVDLLNVPYPQPPPAAMSWDNSQLRANIGSNASLLSAPKTLEMYRQNIKKTNSMETQYSFAIHLIQLAQEAGLTTEGSVSSQKKSSRGARDSTGPYVENAPSSPQELIREARSILQKLSDRGYPFAQYYLADGYASGLFNKGKQDYSTAFPLFVSASKHGHAESGYRAALCYEFGWGSRKDPAKAVQFYRQSASKNHPGAMTRLGRACLSGDLGEKQYREGLKWLKRATESADEQYNAAPFHLGLLYETGYGDDIFKDETYAAQLFTMAADLGHAEANYRLGDAYEHGKLSCPKDAALSVHFYTGAAQRGHPAAMMALCAWYMIGAEPVLPKDENEAYEWARQAAECGLTKAEYAVGYFKEMGIGCRRDILEANVWYVKAAESGDERAKHRLSAIRAAASGGKPMEVAPPRNGAKIKKGANDKEKDKDCKIM
ncbi:chitin synthase activator [Phlyctema vagabunda]|uniref:Chitin synthase activator n=1 Tax=Phlyctema vagabunda TaxID=108571 RepID=A0ABR4PNA4_9HELO